MTATVTRFAPSPTGYLHIGGARTALFNWLLARSQGGAFRLRVEDTDRARSTDDAMNAIMDGLRWLGLEWNDEVVFQSQRQARHVEVAQQLLDAGNAYRCYATPEELAEMRETARAEKRPPGYNGLWRDRDPSEAPDAPFVVRLRVPKDGATVIKDAVQGDVTIANKELDDLVLLRSDGTPTYMLSVVVDDHDMGVTMVLRGDDHLTNAARQMVIYQLLGWPVPEMGHVPLIHGPDGAKLSKRHGALGVEAYREMGYLPAALRNYLLRLGWSHGDDEIISDEQALAWFGTDGLGKSPSRIDFKKLENLNGVYLRQMSSEAVLDELLTALPHLPNGPTMQAAMNEEKRALLLAAMPGLKERAKTLNDLVEASSFVWHDRPLPMSDKAERILDDDGLAVLARASERLNGLEVWDEASMDEALRTLAEDMGLKLGKIAQPLRAGLTGSHTSPGIYDVMLVLGRDESLARLNDHLIDTSRKTA